MHETGVQVETCAWKTIRSKRDPGDGRALLLSMGRPGILNCNRKWKPKELNRILLKMKTSLAEGM